MADYPFTPEAAVDSIQTDVKVCGCEKTFTNKIVSLTLSVAEIRDSFLEDKDGGELVDALNQVNGCLQIRVFSDEQEPFILNETEYLFDSCKGKDILGIEFHIEGAECSTAFERYPEDLVKYVSPS